MRSLLFVYNPAAGKGQIRRHLSYILERLSQAGYELTVFPTGKQGDAARFVERRGAGYNMVVCSGGDGTMNEVTTGLMKLSEPPLMGYLPAGTVNDFASSLKIPKNIEKAVDTLIRGKAFECDIGSIVSEGLEKQYFTYVAGFGAFTEVSYETPQNIKNVLGKTAYFLDGLTKLPNIKPYRMYVEYEDQVIDEEFIFGMVTNSKSVGGFQGITGKEVYLDDGKFDIMLIRPPKNPVDLQNIVNSLLTKKLNTKNICHFHSERILFRAYEPIPWVLDGESGGFREDVVIQNNHKALKIMVPKEEKILLEQKR